jgi:hypothetical protein
MTLWTRKHHLDVILGATKKTHAIWPSLFRVKFWYPAHRAHCGVVSFCISDVHHETKSRGLAGLVSGPQRPRDSSCLMRCPRSTAKSADTIQAKSALNSISERHVWATAQKIWVLTDVLAWSLITVGQGSVGSRECSESGAQRREKRIIERVSTSMGMLARATDDGSLFGRAKSEVAALRIWHSSSHGCSC